MEEYINSKIIPRVRGDGGWAEFGECSKCAILDRCLAWICQEVKKDLGLDIRVNPIRRKPFFWDE